MLPPRRSALAACCLRCLPLCCLRGHACCAAASSHGCCLLNCLLSCWRRQPRLQRCSGIVPCFLLLHLQHPHLLLLILVYPLSCWRILWRRWCSNLKNVSAAHGNIRSHNLEAGTRYLVPGTRYHAPGTRCLAPVTWFQVPRTRHSVPCTWYPVTGTRYQVPGTRFMEFLT